MTTFYFLTRLEWGGTWDGAPRVEKLLDPELYVHHVGGGAYMGGTVALGYWPSRAAAIRVFQQLNDYAKDVKNYQFLDYDALVWYDRFNDIVWIAEGRGEYMSAATRDRNEQGEAVCLCGNTDLRAPAAAELEGIARAIVWAAQKGWITGSAKIYGHRDNPAHPGATSCPGGYLYAKLPTIRARVSELLNPVEESVVNWNPSASTVASVTAMPSVASTLDNDVDTWAVIGLVKAVQELKGLPVTGKPDQATWDAVNTVLKA